MRETTYLIIGNSAAAIGGVQGIRKTDATGSITLVSDEPYHTYSRPLISYRVEGAVTDEQMRYREADFYEKNGVDTLLGTAVLSIDPAQHTAVLADNTQLHYEKLLLATGSHPFVPPIKGKDNAKNAMTFTKMDDMKMMMDILEACEEEGRAPKAVILGAGLIGLKAAEALYGKAESITVIDLADRVMPSVFDEKASGVMADHILDKDIALRLNTSIAEIGDMQVTLSDDSVLDYDILVLAVGTRPAAELAEAAGIACDRGILAGTDQRTAAEDVFAAGDCVKSHDISSGIDRNIAILPNAFMQGETAGINMAGGEAVFDEAFPVNAMGLLGLYMLTAGSYEGELTVIEEAGAYKEFFIKDDTLKGYIIIGDCQRGGIYTDLIRKQTPLYSLDLESILREPGIMPLPEDTRRHDLAEPH